MLPNLRDIQHVFFEALGNGYALGAMGDDFAFGAKKTTIVELPGSKVISFEGGKYKVMDCYYVTPHSDKSVGQTMIWYDHIPVWSMHYGGRYAEIAIPFLKECLHRAYVTERRFYGGRGPHFVRGERFTYFNHIRRGSFSDFEGKEFIFDLSEQCYGSHWYHGMSMLPHD